MKHKKLEVTLDSKGKAWTTVYKSGDGHVRLIRPELEEKHNKLLAALEAGWSKKSVKVEV